MLFAAAIWLSVVEANRPVAEAPLDPMSIRITVTADGAMRVERTEHLLCRHAVEEEKERHPVVVEPEPVLTVARS